jgi:hypothetical protein
MPFWSATWMDRLAHLMAADIALALYQCSIDK